EGGRIMDRAWVRTALAKIKAGLDVIELQNWKQAWAIDNDRLQPAEASALKVNSSEFFVEAYRLFMEVLGEQSSIKQTSPGAILRAQAERYYRALIVFTFGGGTNEVQRDLIAAMGLGLPRYGYGG
ncbi:MAG: acyl-CoA dehydrogenase, partial [Deltaproteobacteria bacterium]|nr:acyl-CoA dehydrogenase [Deltaproteobacteria bacterium]